MKIRNLFMLKTISPQILVKKRLTADENEQFKEYILTIDEDIIDFRKKISQSYVNEILPAIISDVQNGYSPIIVICGQQQKGKTRLAVTLANILSVFLYYKWFEKKYFKFQPEDILKEMTDEGYQIFVLDESGASGTGINKNEWFSKVNKLVDYIFQTQAFLKNIYILTLPFLSDLTKDVRKYVDYILSAKKLLKRRKKKDKKTKKFRTVSGYSEFWFYKVHKKYDQMEKDIKSFWKVWIEKLIIRENHVPSRIWNPIDKMCQEFKHQSRRDKVKEFMELNIEKERKDWFD